MNNQDFPNLAIRNLTLGYRTEEQELDVVRRVSLDIAAGESFGLVGESGSGKSTLAMGAIGYMAENGYIRQGEVLLQYQLISGLNRRQMAQYWGKTIGVVYQNPLTALNPSLVIGQQIAEAARAHRPLSRAEAVDLTHQMLTRVAMPKPEAIAGLYPHQLSGGMLQRCVIAMALINSPDLLIMDEPTTALDVTSQAVVLDLVAELQQSLSSTILYITHDLAALTTYPPPAASEEVLTIQELNKHYPVGGSLFTRNTNQVVKAVNGISLTLNKGFTMGIVGESGCGKTTLIRTIMGLLPLTSGEIRLNDQILPSRVEERPLATLQKLQMVFQNPEASLNPRQTVAQAIQRPMILLHSLSDEQIITRTFELLTAVNLPASYYNRLPAELSGGEKQRVAIARSFAADPSVVLLDEPLSALDVSVQASLINLLFDLQTKNLTTYLFISHDLATVQHLSDWIAVLYLGRIMETGHAASVFAPPYHPYTEALLSAIPVADPNVKQQHIRLEGSVPSAMEIPSGCPFHTRCPRRLGQLCATELPPWQEGDDGHGIWCHIAMTELARIQDKAEHANVSVIIGGAPVTQDFADEIGAHGYAEDAPGAVELLRRLVA